MKIQEDVVIQDSGVERIKYSQKSEGVEERGSYFLSASDEVRDLLHRAVVIELKAKQDLENMRWELEHNTRQWQRRSDQPGNRPMLLQSLDLISLYRSGYTYRMRMVNRLRKEAAEIFNGKRSYTSCPEFLQ